EVLADDAKTEDVMVDMTPSVQSLVPDEKISGKVWVGFSNPQKEEIYKLEGTGRQTQPKIQFLRKFIELKEELSSNYHCDYILIDTSPGIRYWSINSLAIADILLLTLKFGDLDIEGTRRMANDIYTSLTKFGAKSFLLLNRVGGYCVPNTLVLPHSHDNLEGTVTVPQVDEGELGSTLSKQVSMDLISAIPCYCDIQFSRKEFLTALQYPNHPFAKQLERLSKAQQLKL
ncbi:MAG: MinD/ParA family ATP-binding protein, partial [Nitrososphaerales archaeon]